MLRLRHAYSIFINLHFCIVCNCYRREREKYEKHRRKGQKNPSTYLSIIIDGMDQSKTDLPHIITNPKVLAGCHTLGTHVTGVKVHGRDMFIYIDWGNLPHDSNLTLSLILRSLASYKVHICTYTWFHVNNKCIPAS